MIVEVALIISLRNDWFYIYFLFFGIYCFLFFKIVNIYIDISKSNFVISIRINVK